MQGAQQPQQRPFHVPAQGSAWAAHGPCGCDGRRIMADGPGGHRAGAGYTPARGPVQGPPHDQPFVLVGLDAIGRAVGAGQGAVKRWIREDGFPARRCSDGTYRADPDAVRRWFWGGHRAAGGDEGAGPERGH